MLRFSNIYITFAILINFGSRAVPEFQNDSYKVDLNISYKETGYHRTLCYNVNIQGTAGSTKVLIRNVLPKDMYIDPYQVSEKNGVFIKEFVDIEMPSYLAKPLHVEFCSISKNNLHKVCIPVHFRYQLPHQCEVHGKTILTTIDTPSTFIQINKYSEECIRNTETEPWIRVKNIKVQPQSFEIPTGCLEEFDWVLLLISVTVVFSTIYLTSSLTKI